jgi:hypothetical protein
MYASLSKSDDEAETEVVFDTERDHYQVVNTGWENRRPMYGCVLHLDIKSLRQLSLSEERKIDTLFQFIKKVGEVMLEALRKPT